jgi:DNA-binding transcriptional ArsR family regulator
MFDKYRMNTTEFVHAAMPPAQGLRVEVVSGSAFETLIEQFMRTREEGSSELWLHLLGLALERPDDLAGAVRDTPASELRRHLVGVHVPAWRLLVGVEALEAAARGDEALLAHERYYAGQARASLAAILPLTPAQTKRRVLAVVERFAAEAFDDDLGRVLAAEAAAARRLDLEPLDLIEALAGGYRYEPEAGIDRVVLVPHLAARPWLLLCQHDRTRIVCYPVREPAGLEERALLVGRALADEGRVRMLRRLAAGDATLAQLAETAGVARSTAHHHLSHLRAAGLVTMHGNARVYWFTLRREGLRDARRTLGELAG